eukprot:3629577-Pleurochrysis_carterae.AAC.1
MYDERLWMYEDRGGGVVLRGGKPRASTGEDGADDAAGSAPRGAGACGRRITNDEKGEADVSNDRRPPRAGQDERGAHAPREEE